MKETEEETWQRMRFEHYHLFVNEEWFDLAKIYHQERIKSCFSEKEIEKIAENKIDELFVEDRPVYIQGFKDALTLLTKGDR